jgi:hypothetical protein
MFHQASVHPVDDLESLEFMEFFNNKMFHVEHLANPQPLG